jgi:hypothetical protein
MGETLKQKKFGKKSRLKNFGKKKSATVTAIRNAGSSDLGLKSQREREKTSRCRFLPLDCREARRCLDLDRAL